MNEKKSFYERHTIKLRIHIISPYIHEYFNVLHSFDRYQIYFTTLIEHSENFNSFFNFNSANNEEKSCAKDF